MYICECRINELLNLPAFPHHYNLVDDIMINVLDMSIVGTRINIERRVRDYDKLITDCWK